jgi:hypothetical protein
MSLAPEGRYVNSPGGAKYSPARRTTLSEEPQRGDMFNSCMEIIFYENKPLGCAGPTPSHIERITKSAPPGLLGETRFIHLLKVGPSGAE